jgi:hypothetical protein
MRRNRRGPEFFRAPRGEAPALRLRYALGPAAAGSASQAGASAGRRHRTRLSENRAWNHSLHDSAHCSEQAWIFCSSTGTQLQPETAPTDTPSWEAERPSHVRSQAGAWERGRESLRPKNKEDGKICLNSQPCGEADEGSGSFLAPSFGLSAPGRFPFACRHFFPFCFLSSFFPQFSVLLFARQAGAEVDEKGKSRIGRLFANL